MTTAAALLDRIQTHDTRIRDRAVVVNGEPQGLLIPSTFIAEPDAAGRSWVYGPKGLSACESDDAESVWAALIATGCILFGSPDDIASTAKMLDAPRASRTISYLCAVAPDCKSVVDAAQRLGKARVLVLGAGGIGSMVAMVLAGAGIGHLTVVDHDVVEASNLNRQFFYGPADIGRRKVEVLAQSIRERYADVSVRAVVDAANVDNLPALLADVDLVVIGADDPPHLASDAARLANEAGVDAISCGYVHGEGTLTLLTHETRETEPQSSVRWMRVPGGIMPSFGPANVELAGVASSTAVLRLCGLLRSDTGDLHNKWKTSELPRHWLTDL